MPRRFRRARSAPHPYCESLEARTLLAYVGPLPNPDANVLSTLLVGFAAGASPAVIRAELAPFDATVTQSFPNGPSIVSLGRGVSQQAAVAQLQAIADACHRRLQERDVALQVLQAGQNSLRTENAEFRRRLQACDNVNRLIAEVARGEASVLTRGSQ